MPQPQVDVVLGVPALRVHERRVALGLALQVALRQRRALVGAVRLGAEQDQAPVEPLGAQRLHGLGPGQAGPDDGEGAGVAHRTPSLRSVDASRRRCDTDSLASSLMADRPSDRGRQRAGCRPWNRGGEGEELGARARILPQQTAHRRGRGRASAGPDAAQGHAQVLGLDDDPDAARVQMGLQPVGHLDGQPLLDLGAPGEQLDHPRELGQPEDPLAPAGTDVGAPRNGSMWCSQTECTGMPRASTSSS